jgi:hypothetical protein
MSDDEKENFVFENIPDTDEQTKDKKYNKRLTFYDTIKLGPIEKYKQHNIFPWKLIISILLVIFSVSQSVLIVGDITSYSRAQVRGFYNLFIDDSDKTDPDYNREVYLYSLDELKYHMRSSINVILVLTYFRTITMHKTYHLTI